MQWQQGDMLEYAQAHKISTICFTANGIVSGGRLVCGAGAALDVKRKFPSADRSLGNLLEYKRWKQGLQGDYFTLETEQLTRNWLGDHNVDAVRIVAVQVKRDWRDNGDWHLTEKSLLRLRADLNRWRVEKDRPEAVLNCPLIGRGGFSDRKDEVFKMVEYYLEDMNITVFTL